MDKMNIVDIMFGKAPTFNEDIFSIYNFGYFYRLSDCINILQYRDLILWKIYHE